MSVKIFYIDRFVNYSTLFFQYLQRAAQNYNEYKISFIGPKKKDVKNWLSDQDVADSKRIWKYNHYVYSIYNFVRKEKPHICHFLFEVKMFGSLSASFKFPLLLLLVRLTTKTKIILTIRPIFIYEEGAKWKIIEEIIPYKIPSFLFGIILKIFYKMICNFSHKITVEAENIKRGLIEYYGIKPEKIKVIRFGIPTHPIKLDYTTLEKLKQQFRNKKIILCFGLISPRKSQDKIIMAFNKIKQKIPNHVLVIAGLTTAGEKLFEQSLHKLIKNLNLEKRVFLTGYIDDKETEALFHISEISLYIYHPYPGASAAIFDAIRHNKPCILSRSDTFLEMFSESDAIFVEHDNVDELADKMLNLVTREDLRKDLQQKMNVILNKFPMEKSASELLSLYQNILN